jgi:hypothetical protein
MSLHDEGDKSIERQRSPRLDVIQRRQMIERLRRHRLRIAGFQEAVARARIDAFRATHGQAGVSIADASAADLLQDAMSARADFLAETAGIVDPSGIVTDVRAAFDRTVEILRELAPE